MSHTNIHHRRTHNLLLISKLLNQRDAASPLTLVLDSLEQPAAPLVREYIRRANLAKTNVIFLGFEAVRAPAGVDDFVACHDKTPEDVARAVASVANVSRTKRHLIMIDSLHSLCTLSLQPSSALELTGYLSSLVAPRSDAENPASTMTLVAIYHADIPIPHNQNQNPYAPSPLNLLTYLSTTILTLHPLSHLLSAQHHNSRSQEPPPYGLDEHKAGVVAGLKPAKWTRQLQLRHKGLVIELEHRRKSGRGVREWYFLPAAGAGESVGVGITKENVTLLDDHPLFRTTLDNEKSDREAGLGDLSEMTFELGLTERQRLERDGVVLPYFDAQKGGGFGGPGEGGRILYDMGEEDDFDEEEDEI